MLMAQILQADDNAETVPSYDAKAVSEVNTSSKVHEQMRYEKRKTIIQTSNDEQIDSNIIFDDPYVENNGGTSDLDSNDHDEYHKIQMLAYDAQREAKNQKQFNNELKRKKMLLQKELEMCKDRVKMFELEREELEPKKAFKDRENQYLEDICDLEEKLNSHDRIVYKIGQSIQTIYMLGKTPNKVYDPFLKAGLGYKNPERLKKAIAAQPKMYDSERLHSVNVKIHSPDLEETLEDAEESRLKMRNKMVQINYGKLNALYETFIQDLLITIFELKNKLKTVNKGKNVNTKFDKFDALGTLLCVTPLTKNIAIKAKKVSNSKVNVDRSKPVTSHSTPTNEQESSNSVRRQKFKDTKSKNRVLKNTNDKISTAHVRKMSHSVSIDSSKCETMNLTLCHANKSVLNTKNVTAINDGSNIVCVPCGKDVFLLSHEKCVARYALSRNSNVKRALFTTPVVAKSKNLGATSVVAKSRLSVANTPKATDKVIQLIIWIVDNGCSKHITSNLQLLRNYVEKFMGTVRFGIDHFAAITGYGDYVQGNLTICYVYYVEGLGHKLILVGQFCDGDLEVPFRSNTCYVRNLEGDDLLTGSCDSNLYTISISEMAASSTVCLISRATSTKSWLWHRRLSHLNFACEQGKSKKASLPPKLVPSTESKLELLHMDLCGSMRVAKINGKKCILVIIDDYSQYTWVYFLRTKDEAPDMIIDFINQVQRNLKAQILTIQTDNGTEFKNEKLRAFYAKLDIVHQTSIAYTP
ncbi:retrovirus-related pol polyprotein from transposon TNT 1-94 [Tanacetum coccineum]